VASKFVSERNIKFLLYEVFDVESLTKYEYYSEHNRKMFDMVLKAAVKLAKNLLFPIFKDINFYEGKMFTLRYFFGYELPKTLGLAKRLMDDDRLTVEMQIDYFND
jgi:hypothetical protein